MIPTERWDPERSNMWPKVTQKARQQRYGFRLFNSREITIFSLPESPKGSHIREHSGSISLVSVPTVTIITGIQWAQKAHYDTLTLLRFESRQGEKIQFVRVDPDVLMWKNTQGTMWNEKNHVQKLMDKVVSLL